MSIEGFAIVELLGHRTRIGKISEEEVFGTKMLRIDIAVEDSTEFVTEYYGGGAIYGIQPVTEEVLQNQYGYRKKLPARPVSYRDEMQDPVKRLEHAIEGEDDGDDIPFEDRSQDVHGTRFDARDEILAE